MQAVFRPLALCISLGTIVACRSPKGPYLTGASALTTPSARSVDALWAIALPPVVVDAPRADQARRGTAAPPHADTVRVTLREWKLELSPAQVASGTVVFRVRNEGATTHAFEIEGKGMERETRPIAPGAEGTMSVRLRAGQYEAYCPVGEGTAHPHKSMGMLAKLVVRAEAGGTGRSS